ncbi:MAG: tRNA (cytidine(34)-2'-O)-methyltransferase [Deltaproteobacteria bacterium]|nr:tRNA (cytidine(34)-2'-O)-methyltransferase [Deltaproteobacteria bacterium]
MQRIDRTFTEKMRLRFQKPDNPFRVVLVEPEIPLNTGSIARLCAATGSRLVIAGNPSFSLNSADLKRAGVDYWEYVKFEQYSSLDEYIKKNTESGIFLFSAKADKSYLECDFKPGASLVFGKESTGLPDDIITKYKNRLFAIPTIENIRSINLSNAAAIIIYEALRKTGFLNKVCLSE